MPVDIYDLEQRLWEVADELRANSSLSSAEYSTPVLGLIFLRFAGHRFDQAKADLEGTGSGRRDIGPADYQAKGVLYLPPEAEFDKLVNLPEGDNIGEAINNTMRAVETHNTDLVGVLPKTFQRFDNSSLVELLRLFNNIPGDITGDAFGKIYEYFLGNFAMAEGSKGGEFFTPTSIVDLIVNIIEPTGGKLLDPACGSGGMFVQSARFVDTHRQGATDRVSIYGQERVTDTVKLAKMNLAVHGLAGDIQESNTYYEDPHDAVGKFDYVMANPPFNVNKVDNPKLEDDPRFPFGLPKPDNANYLWIQIFYSALNKTGRAGFVMANSASDARSSELEIRKQLIQTGAVDCIVAVGTNMFYTVTLPVTLWFLDNNKPKSDQANKVLFIDARDTYEQVDRAHRTWTPTQIELLANIHRLANNTDTEVTTDESQALLDEHFPDGTYTDVLGLCKVATIDEIEEQGWSLNPGRYVGLGVAEMADVDFEVEAGFLAEQWELLSNEAVDLGALVSHVISEVLE